METVETVKVEELEAAEPVPVLSMKDKCDKCGHQAYVLTKGIESDLMFCGHHYRDYEISLISWAFEVIDERHLIPA